MYTIENRIEALERSDRRHRYISIALALVVLVMVEVVAGPKDVPEVIRDQLNYYGWTNYSAAISYCNSLVVFI